MEPPKRAYNRRGGRFNILIVILKGLAEKSRIKVAGWWKRGWGVGFTVLLGSSQYK